MVVVPKNVDIVPFFKIAGTADKRWYRAILEGLRTKKNLFRPIVVNESCTQLYITVGIKKRFWYTTYYYAKGDTNGFLRSHAQNIWVEG